MERSIPDFPRLTTAVKAEKYPRKLKYRKSAGMMHGLESRRKNMRGRICSIYRQTSVCLRGMDPAA